MWAIVVNIFKTLGPMLLGPAGTFISGLNFAQLLGELWTNFKKYWRFIIPVILISLQAVTAYGWFNDHNALRAERVAHATDIKTYKDAQATALAKAEQEKKQLKLESQVKADEADQSYSSLLAKYRASLVRYQATSSSPGPDGGGQPSDTPQGAVGPGEGTFISLEDADTCAVNTARLQAAHDWAIHLGESNDPSH